MSTDTQQAPTATRRLPTRRLVTTGIVMLLGYSWIARGSIAGGVGGVAGDGTWIDGRGQPTTEAPLTYAIELGPSPLVALVVIALLGVAWATSEVRGRLAWLAPACEVAAIVVPVLAIAATIVWIRGFGVEWDAGTPIATPWWSTATITIDRMG